MAEGSDPVETAEPGIRSVGRGSGGLCRGRRMAARHRVENRDIGRLLLDWYARGHRELPWRSTRDPYEIWVSEIMLQQTRAQAVIPYYRRFLDRFPTVAALAAAGENEVLAVWSGLG